MEKQNQERSRTTYRKDNSTARSRSLSVPRSTQSPNRQTDGVNVKEIRKIVQQRIATPNRASRSASRTNNVNIPINKVNELRQILIDQRRNINQERKKNAQMSSKKRAQIEERWNRVDDIHRMLNDIEVQNKSVTGTPSSLKAGLNLPMNRVNEMKNWLVEFEKQNKKHAQKYSSKSHNIVNYVPRAGARNQLFELQNDRQNQQVQSSSASVDTSSMNKVSNLKQWLVDFEKGNKAHYEKGKNRPEFGLSGTRYKRPETEIDHIDNADDVDTKEDKEREFGNDVDDSAIYESSKGNNLNISMIPAATNSISDDDQSDWEDDYQELMQIDIDIEQIASADSWDKESFQSPREDVPDEEENDMAQDSLSLSRSKNDEDALERISLSPDTIRDSEEVIQRISLSPDSSVESAVKIIELSADSTELSLEKADGEEEIVEQETEEEDHAPKELQQDLSSDEDKSKLIVFEDDSVSRLTLDEALNNATISAKDFEMAAIPTEETEEDDVESLNETTDAELAGERLMISTSSGIRFANESTNKTADLLAEEVVGKQEIRPVSAKEDSKTVTVKTKKNGGFFSNFFGCTKTSSVVKSTLEEGNESNAFLDSIKQGQGYKQTAALAKQGALVSTKSLDLSPDSKVGAGYHYLPSTYALGTRNCRDFGREMLSYEKKVGMTVVGESPMSAASAYRREALSPSGSAISGFTDFETMNAVTRSNNFEPHVGWLKEKFSTPAPVAHGERV